MTVSSKEREARKVKVLVDRDVVDTSFEKWAKPGHFSRTLAKGPKTTTWIWNLHADAHDFDSQTNSLEKILAISRIIVVLPLPGLPKIKIDLSCSRISRILLVEPIIDRPTRHVNPII